MKKAPTLLDRLYRDSFHKELVYGWKSNVAMRERLTNATRFVLDDSMSGFLADLATAGFRKQLVGLAKGSFNTRMADQMRVSARSPHKLVWIEYNLRATTQRSYDLGVHALSGPMNPLEVPSREGWLIEQHPGVETAFRMHLFSEVPEGEADVHGYTSYTFPFCYGWTSDDSPLPWNLAIPSTYSDDDRPMSEVYLGVVGYGSERVGVVESELIRNFREHPRNKADALCRLLREWTGVMRRVWALLATINDIPMEFKDVRQSKGFVARGQYRKFLDHKTITLKIPGRKDQQKVARNLIAAARRRAHPVRGHFRRDWRHPGASQCLHHWDIHGLKCELCGGRRSWIAEHVRGDASLGFVTHDYQVTHETSDA